MSDREPTTAATARDQLIGDLHRTVETVSAAIAATAARVDGLATVETAQLQRLSRELVDRATGLDREIAALGERAASDSDSATLHPRPETPEFTLDDVEASRAAITGAPTGGSTRRFRRSATGDDDVPASLRLVVSHMRHAGATDSEISHRLEELGVADPAGVIARTDPYTGGSMGPRFAD